MRRSKGYLLLAFVLFATLPLQALALPDGHNPEAQPPADSEATELRRELAEHNFIPSRFSLDPFVATYVGSETGFGYGSAPGRIFDVNGNPVSTGASSSPHG